MELVADLKLAICGLFEVHTDSSSVQWIVTPIAYPGSGDKIVVRVRPSKNGFKLDENGEAALYASMAGADLDSDTVSRWAEELSNHSPTRYDPTTEIITAFTFDERLIAPYIFRIAEAAQQLYALATVRAERKTSDFKDCV